jgi:hypothetical protein
VITEAILSVFGAVMGFVLGLFPEVARPAWLDSAITTLADGIGYIPLLDNWFPLEAIANSILFILLCLGVAFAIRAFRMGLSLVTGGGGSAA